MAAERGGAAVKRRPMAALERRLGEVLGLSLKECAPEGAVKRLFYRIQDRAFDGLEDYAEYLLYAADRPAWEDLAETLTANESRVFGDPADFSPLFELTSDRTGKPYRCLSAGCGTGEEAYSLAVALAEVASRSTGFAFEVLGADLSARAVAAARRATYPTSRVASMPAELRERYFIESHGNAFAAALKPHVRFARLNLCEPDSLLRLGTFDLVLARGFLPSLTAEGRRTALANLADALTPGGVLLLGPGDSIGDTDLGLVPIRWGDRFAYERPHPQPAERREPDETPDPALALVAHRSPVVRAWIRILLEQRGLFVEEASQGIQALEQVAAGRAPSFYFLERTLPPRGGPWVMERLARLVPRAMGKVVYLSPGDSADPPTLSLPLTSWDLDQAFVP